MIGSVGETEFRIGDGGPELVKSANVRSSTTARKPSSIHRHVGQRPIMAAGNTDGDLAMLQWTAASPYRTLELVVHHTDGDREYAYDRDPILGSGTGQILAAAAEHVDRDRHGRRLGHRPPSGPDLLTQPACRVTKSRSLRPSPSPPMGVVLAIGWGQSGAKCEHADGDR